MKLRKYHILFACFLFVTISCDRWLDVSPKTETKESNLFSKESGYKSALLGQYIKMSGATLYGGNLSMSFMDALAQYYSLGDDKNTMYHAQGFNYTHEEIKPIITNIWNSLYEVIANLNNMVYNMEQNKGLFTGSSYNIIKGEALGLRAYIHLDLLRMYAPSYVIGKDKLAIPYVNKLSNIPFQQKTVEQTIELIIADLLEAESLLKDVDPIGPAFPKYSDNAGENAEYESDNGFMLYRRERMNYYAVVATLARAYLYGHNHEQANIWANICVKSGRMAPDNAIFQLYSDKLSTISDRYFNSKLDNKNKLQIEQIRKNGYYQTDKYGSIDNRLKSWFNYYPNSNEEFMSKYMKQADVNPVNIVLMRGAEAYYIAAETAIDDEARFALLNQVRNAFGVSKVYDLTINDDFETELFAEYRKSMVAEGQLFYFYKRKNYSAIEYTKEENFPALYTFPLPDREIEFGNIK